MPNKTINQVFEAKTTTERNIPVATTPTQSKVGVTNIQASSTQQRNVLPEYTPVSGERTDVSTGYAESQTLDDREKGFFNDLVKGGASSFEQLRLGLIGLTDPDKAADLARLWYSNDPNTDDIGYQIGSIIGGIIPSAAAIALMATPVGPAAIYGLSAFYGAVAAGSSRMRIAQYEAVHGDVVSDGQEWALAIGSGIVAAGVEIISDFTLGRGFAKIGEKTLLSLSDDVGKQFLKGELKGKGLLKTLNKFMPSSTEVVFGGLTEGAEEAIQGMLDNALDHMYNPETKLGDNVLQATLGGFAGGMLLGATVGRFIGHHATMQDLMIGKQLEKEGYEFGKIRSTLTVARSMKEVDPEFNLGAIIEDKQAVERFVNMSDRIVNMTQARAERKSDATPQEMADYVTKIKEKYDPDNFYSYVDVKKILEADSFQSFWNATNKVVSLNKIISPDAKTQEQIDLHKLQKEDFQKTFNATDDEAIVGSAILDVTGMSGKFQFQKGGKVAEGALFETRKDEGIQTLIDRGFYSKLNKVILDSPQNKLELTSLRNLLSKNGVTKEEMDDSALDEIIETLQNGSESEALLKSATKQEILELLNVYNYNIQVSIEKPFVANVLNLNEASAYIENTPFDAYYKATDLPSDTWLRLQPHIYKEHTFIKAYSKTIDISNPILRNVLGSHFEDNYVSEYGEEELVALQTGINNVYSVAKNKDTGKYVTFDPWGTKVSGTSMERYVTLTEAIASAKRLVNRGATTIVDPYDDANYTTAKYEDYSLSGGTDYTEKSFYPENINPDGAFDGSHFGPKGTFLHTRTKRHTTDNNKTATVLIEDQSDLHQIGFLGRYGKRDAISKRVDEELLNLQLDLTEKSRNDEEITKEDRLALLKLQLAKHNIVPDSPFKKLHMLLGFKEALADAVFSGDHFIAMPTGEQEQGFYGVREQEEVEWYRKSKSSVDYYFKFKGQKEYTRISMNDVLKVMSGNTKLATMILSSEELKGAITKETIDTVTKPLIKLYNETLPKMFIKYVQKKLDHKAEWTTIKIKGEGVTVLDDEVLHTVKAIPITDQIRERVKAGQELYQHQNGEITGAMTVRDNGQIVLQGMKNADFVTGIHEIGHGIRELLFNRNVPLTDRQGITNDMLTNVENWAGVKNGIWTRKASEKFTNGLIKYLRKGKAPTTKLQPLFDKVGNWLRRIYKKVLGTELEPKLNKGMIEAFDALMMRADEFVPPTTEQPVFPNMRTAEQMSDYAGLKYLEKTQQEGIMKSMEALYNKVNTNPQLIDSPNMLKALHKYAPKYTLQYDTYFLHMKEALDNKATVSVRIFNDDVPKRLKNFVDYLVRESGSKTEARRILTDYANIVKLQHVQTLFTESQESFDSYAELLEYFPTQAKKLKSDFTEYIPKQGVVTSTTDATMIDDPNKVRTAQDVKSDFKEFTKEYTRLATYDNNKLGNETFLEFIDYAYPDLSKDIKAIMNDDGTFTVTDKKLDKNGDVKIDPETEEEISTTRKLTIEELLVFGTKDVNINKARALFAVHLGSVAQIIKDYYGTSEPSTLANTIDYTDLAEQANIIINPKSSLQDKLNEYDRRVKIGVKLAKKQDTHKANGFSIEANMTKLNAAKTGRAIVKMYDVQMFYQHKGLNFARTLTSDVDFDEKYMTDYIFSTENTEYINEMRVSEDEKVKIRKISGMLKAFFAEADATNKSFGIYDKNFQEERSAMFQNTLDTIDQKLFYLKQAKGKGKGINEQIVGLTNQRAVAEELKLKYSNGTFNFIPIPYIQYILNKVRLDTVYHKRTMAFLLSHKRRAVFIQDLFKKGVLDANEITIVDIISAYTASQGRDIAIAMVKQAAIEDGLLKPLLHGNNPASGFREVRPQDSPAFKTMTTLNGKEIVNTQVHISLLATLASHSKVFEPTLYYRMVTTMKLWAFGRPAVLGIYDSIQAIMAGTNATSLKELRRAYKDITGNTIRHQMLQLNGGQSSPLAMPSQRLMNLIKINMKHKNMREGTMLMYSALYDIKDWYNSSIEDIKNIKPKDADGNTEPGINLTRYDTKTHEKRALGLSSVMGFFNSIYHVTHDMAWSVDIFIRQISFNKLLDKGFSPAEAGYNTSLIHGQYADVPKGTRMKLNKIFFTPTYKIVMTKLYKNMITSSWKIVSQPGKANMTNKQMGIALMRLLAIRWAIDKLLTDRGFERKEFARKYSIQVTTVKGVRDFNLSLMGPQALWDKYYNKIKKIVMTTDPLGEELLRQFQGELTPMLRIAKDVFLQNRKENGDMVVNRLDPYPQQKIDQAKYIFKQAIQLFKPFYPDTQAPGKIKLVEDAKQQLYDDYGKLAGWFINQFAFVYYGQTERMKDIQKLKALRALLVKDPTMRRIQQFNVIVNRLLSE